MNNNKPRVIKDFEKLDAAVQEKIREAYPNGYGNALIAITNKDGMLISALPFETEDRYYLVKMPVRDAKIIEEDDDFSDDVFIKESTSKQPDLDAEFKDEFGNDEEADEDDEDEDEDFDDEDDDEVSVDEIEEDED